MIYSKENYHRVIKAIKNFVKLGDLDSICSCLEVAFRKIKQEEELKKRGTDLVKLIQSCKILKKFEFKLNKAEEVCFTIIGVNEFESGLLVVYEPFENGRQTEFILYDTLGGIMDKYIK